MICSMKKSRPMVNRTWNCQQIMLSLPNTTPAIEGVQPYTTASVCVLHALDFIASPSRTSVKLDVTV
jgi:hypothetical protein